ncbi:uncharacterized protein [Ptychodera flava]|uniref:uncharacterized protein n=1 Tax=Ptychodera flava TaxID=63121 RepID=UPI003969F152
MTGRAGMNLPMKRVGSSEAYGADLATGFYNKPELSDVVLRVGKNDYHVHKFLLAHFSDVMKTMLMETRWGDAQKHIVELTETDEAAAVFDSFLRFMYCGQIEVNIDTAIPVLDLANKYNVQSLKSVCGDYMAKKVFQYRNVRAALQWWLQANSYNSVSLDSDCFDLIVLSLDEAIASPEWQYLDIDQMCAILETSESIVFGEFFLYEAVEKWLQATGERENLRQRVERVLPLIRFSSMTPKEINRVEKSPTYKQFKSQFMPYLYEAFRHHVLKEQQTKQDQGYGYNQQRDSESVQLMKMPRCYTGKRVHCQSSSSNDPNSDSFASFSSTVELSWESVFNIVESSCKILRRYRSKIVSTHYYGYERPEMEGQVDRVNLYIGTTDKNVKTSTPVQQRQSGIYRQNQQSIDKQEISKMPSNLVLIYENWKHYPNNSYKIRVDIFESTDTTHDENTVRQRPVATLTAIGRKGSSSPKPHIYVGDSGMFAGNHKMTKVDEEVVSFVERFFDRKLDEQRETTPYSQLPPEQVSPCMYNRSQIMSRQRYTTSGNYESQYPQQLKRMPHPDSSTQLHVAFVNVNLPRQFKLQTCIFVNDG